MRPSHRLPFLVVAALLAFAPIAFVEDTATFESLIPANFLNSGS